MNCSQSFHRLLWNETDPVTNSLFVDTFCCLIGNCSLAAVEFQLLSPARHAFIEMKIWLAGKRWEVLLNRRIHFHEKSVQVLEVKWNEL